MSSRERSAETAAKRASDGFYDALEQMANGDAEPMSTVWSHEDYVTTIHPIGGREVGWDEVRQPWTAVADVASDGRVTRADRLVRVFGELAYELATEKVSMSIGGDPLSFERRATNVYHLEDGEWKVVHHHVDEDSAFVEAIEQLSSGR